jgi:hypothetical protein
MSKQEIATLIERLLGRDFCSHLCAAVLYGASGANHDVDMLMIQETPVPVPLIKIGRLDVTVLHKANFDTLVVRRDPIVTEPILSGQVVIGDTEFLNCSKNVLMNSGPEKCCDYLIRKSLEQTAAVDTQWRQFEHASEALSLDWLLQNLSYAISYMSFAKYYKGKSSSPCTLAHLIETKQVCLPEFWAYRRLVKQGARSLEASSLRNWFQEWLGCLAGI